MDTHRSLRILVHCGGSYVSGMEIAALSVMDGLAARGHTVRCVANAWNDSDFPERLDEAGIPYDELHLGKVSASLSPKYLWWSLNALAHLPLARYRYRRILDRFDPDLVLFYGFDAAPLLRFLHDDVPVAFHVQELPEGSRKLAGVLDRHPDALYIAISEYIADRLRVLGVENSQIRVVHNGIFVDDVFDGHTPSSTVRTQPPFHVGIVGQVGEWKGHEDLIDAIGLLDDDITERILCHVVGSGDAPFVNQMKERARQQGLSDKIRWHGYVHTMADVYENLDMLVVPSRHGEPFGLVAAEAGLWKTPVIASNSGGLPEIIEDGETGFLVPEEDPAAIADRLHTLLTSPDLRREMGEAAHDRVTDHFTAEAMVNGVHEALVELAQQSHSAPT